MPTPITLKIRLMTLLRNSKTTCTCQTGMDLWASTISDGITLGALLRIAEGRMSLCMRLCMRPQPPHHPTVTHIIQMCNIMGRIPLYNIAR
jgi:hypothetical protein